MSSYFELKELARRADRARGKERKQLVDKLIRELPTLDPLEGFSGADVKSKFINQEY